MVAETEIKPRRQKPKLLSILPLLLNLGVTAALRLFRAPFRGSKGAPTVKQDVAYAVTRVLLSKLSAGQSQGFSRTTERVYEREAEEQQWNHHTIDIGNGAKGHWLGRPDAKYVLIFFHGGGYIGYATPGHLKYQFALQKAIRQAGHDISIFSPSYTLAPYERYPFQLSQAVEVLRYLVETEKRDPQTILVGGDSAGGNLATALLLHLAKPHPSVPELRLKSRLKGAILISPFISFDYTTAAFKDNAESDYLTTTALNRASTTFIGPNGTIDEYAEPVRVPPKWWKEVANVVDEILIWGGGGEILIDGIRIFANNIAAGFAEAGASSSPEQMPGTRRVTGRERVFYVETPRASHEEQIMNYTLRIKKKSSGAIVIEEWINARL